MSVQIVEQPYPTFTDRDGSPLDNGYIYVGAANLPPQTNLIAVFYDAALTIVAEQPIRTRGGYAIRNGSPARLYVSGQYSLLVHDSKNTFVYSLAQSEGSAITASVQSFNGTGAQVNYTLATNPGAAESLIVRISGALQTPGVDFTVAGNTLTFTLAPPAGTGNIVVQRFGDIGISGGGSLVNASSVVYSDSTLLTTVITPSGLGGAIEVDPMTDAVTLTAGTANGVLFLDGSKVATSGSALTFNGTNLATTGTLSATKLIPTGGSATGNGMYLPSANTLAWSTNSAEVMRLDSSGNLGIGTLSPSKKLQVANSDALINGITVGRGGSANPPVSNTAFGGSALDSLQNTGVNNTAVGFSALYTNTTAINNTAIGSSTLSFNSTGSNNTAVGFEALVGSLTASNNTAVGYQAGFGNTTGTRNTAIGTQSLYSNTTLNDNTAVGYQSQYAITGGQNTTLGTYAMFAGIGNDNVAIGYLAMGDSGKNGDANIAIGSSALKKATTGNTNVAVGSFSLLNTTIGAQNTAVGYLSMLANISGSTNTAIGHNSGSEITTGSKNTILGSYNGNQGGLDIRTANNYIVLSDGDGNPRGVFDSNGNFGIGTVSPSKKLQVANSDALIHDITVGRGGGSVATNTAVGTSALAAQATSGNSVAFGFQALAANTTGYSNAAFGFRALYVNDTGIENTAINESALGSNTAGHGNVAVGFNALRNNITSPYNTAVGYRGLFNVLGSTNTAIGHNSGSEITTGNKNTILGSYNGNQGGLDIRTANNYIVLSDGDGNPRGVFDSSGNFGIGPNTFGTNAARVLSLGTGTAPTTGPADTVQFFSVDRSAGNTIPAIFCEGSGVTNAGISNVTVTNKIAIQVNGTIYYLLATTNAT